MTVLSDKGWNYFQEVQLSSLCPWFMCTVQSSSGPLSFVFVTSCNLYGYVNIWTQQWISDGLICLRTNSILSRLILGCLLCKAIRRLLLILYEALQHNMSTVDNDLERLNPLLIWATHGHFVELKSIHQIRFIPFRGAFEAVVWTGSELDTSLRITKFMIAGVYHR